MDARGESASSAMEGALRHALAEGRRVRAALSADRQCRRQQGNVLRGAGALAAPGARPEIPGPVPIISLAEDIGLIWDRLANGCCSKACADAANWPNDVKVAVDLFSRCRSLIRPCCRRLSTRWLRLATRSEPARDRDYQVGDDGRTPRRCSRRCTACVNWACEYLARRFRYRLFVAELPAAFSVRQAQDRPVGSSATCHAGATRSRSCSRSTRVTQKVLA